MLICGSRGIIYSLAYYKCTICHRKYNGSPHHILDNSWRYGKKKSHHQINFCAYCWDKKQHGEIRQKERIIYPNGLK